MTTDVTAVTNAPTINDKLGITPELKKTLFLTLSLLGCVRVQVYYSGSGDSGSIESVSGYTQSGEGIDIRAHANCIEWPTRNGDAWIDGKWVQPDPLFTMEVMPLDEILRAYTEAALEVTGLDWYNNEGGQGALNIDLTAEPEPTITLDVGINYTTTDDYGFDLSINDGRT